MSCFQDWRSFGERVHCQIDCVVFFLHDLKVLHIIRLFHQKIDLDCRLGDAALRRQARFGLINDRHDGCYHPLRTLDRMCELVYIEVYSPLLRILCAQSDMTRAWFHFIDMYHETCGWIFWFWMWVVVGPSQSLVAFVDLPRAGVRFLYHTRSPILYPGTVVACQSLYFFRRTWVFMRFLLHFLLLSFGSWIHSAQFSVGLSILAFSTESIRMSIVNRVCLRRERREGSRMVWFRSTEPHTIRNNLLRVASVKSGVFPK